MWKAIFSKERFKKIFDDEKSIVIFSGFGSPFELSRLVKEKNITFPMYVDFGDEFDLIHLITNPKNNPVRIDIKKHIQKKEDK